MDHRDRNLIESTFPNLKPTDYEISSDKDRKYNCIAWAAGCSDKWWEPDSMGTCYWPPGIQRKATLETFKAVFETLGYEECTNTKFESGFKKVAIFAKKGHPTHASRQVDSCLWASKIGPHVDIEHPLEGLVGDHFGSIECILKKPE